MYVVLKAAADKGPLAMSEHGRKLAVHGKRYERSMEIKQDRKTDR